MMEVVVSELRSEEQSRESVAGAGKVLLRSFRGAEMLVEAWVAIRWAIAPWLCTSSQRKRGVCRVRVRLTAI